VRIEKFVLAGAVLFALGISAAGRPATPAQSAFNKLQALAGDWEGTDAEGMAAKTTFKVVAANTAVMETISPMHMEEMVTLYSMDGNSIALIHYCPTNNQRICRPCRSRAIRRSSCLNSRAWRIWRRPTPDTSTGS
jgi:hypothetical protein